MCLRSSAAGVFTFLPASPVGAFANVCDSSLLATAFAFLSATKNQVENYFRNAQELCVVVEIEFVQYSFYSW